jgi:hypothetical protein
MMISFHEKSAAKLPFDVGNIGIEKHYSILSISLHLSELGGSLLNDPVPLTCHELSCLSYRV